jgi:acetyltransferase
MAVSQIERWKAPDGTVLAMRPIHERDGTRIANALRNLSPETRRLRFLAPVNEIPDAFVRGLTEAESSRQYGVIVVRQDGGDEVAIAGGRIAAGDEPGIWEFALLVGDAWQGKGVGKQLLKALIEEAKRRNLQRIIGHISVDNRPMLKLARKSGFSIARDAVDTSTCIATLDIDSRPKVKRSWFARWFGY